VAERLTTQNETFFKDPERPAQADLIPKVEAASESGFSERNVDYLVGL
jgi:hypothetical protein